MESEGSQPPPSPSGLDLRWFGALVPGGPGSVVATGVFDLLHIGHLRFLTDARRAGDRLIIGVEDDERTFARKGFGRPINPALERCEILAAVAPVDGVFMISGPPALPPAPAYTALLAQIGPGTIAFTDGDPAEAGKRAVAARLGAGVHVVSRTEGRSTTLLAELFTAAAWAGPAGPARLELVEIGAERNRRSRRWTGQSG